MSPEIEDLNRQLTSATDERDALERQLRSAQQKCPHSHATTQFNYWAFSIGTTWHCPDCGMQSQA